LGEENILPLFQSFSLLSEYSDGDVELTCLIRTNDTLTSQTEADLQGVFKNSLGLMGIAINVFV
jgi:hypothetical protein